MGKKWILLTILIFSMSMTGCIVINTSEDKKSDESDSTQNKTTTKEVIIQDDDNNDTASNNSTNNSSSSSSDTTSYGDYIFYDSSTRYLTGSDLSGLSKWQLRIARNEIYARHGRLFKDSSLQKYFNSCSWYDGYISPDNFNDDSLNKVEKYNVELIKKYE